LTLTAVLVVGASPRTATAQQTNRVALIVDFGDHHITRCVAFTESEITGYDVLRRSGLDVVVDPSNPMGVTVCDINGTSGCPPSNCFCKCQGSPCVYWSYHYMENGSWRYAQLGASNRKVRDGDVEGWGWGEGTINSSGQEPPAIPFNQICAPPATDTPVPTDTPIPPKNTPIPPTNTPFPTDTPEPTVVPEPEAWFRLDQNPISAGSCTTLRWDVSNAREAHLDGEEVSLSGSRQVCPDATTEYELRALGLAEDEESIYHVTLGITGSAPDASPTPTPSSVPASPSPTTVAVGETVPSTPTEATGSAASPSATLEPSAADPTGPASEARPPASPTATAAIIAQANASPTPERVAEAGGSDESSGAPTASEAETRELEETESPSILLPIGYIAFSLIAGGLLGWLIYVLRFRDHRA
jgi:hypothetical protein